MGWVAFGGAVIDPFGDLLDVFFGHGDVIFVLVAVLCAGPRWHSALFDGGFDRVFVSLDKLIGFKWEGGDPIFDMTIEAVVIDDRLDVFPVSELLGKLWFRLCLLLGHLLRTATIWESCICLRFLFRKRRLVATTSPPGEGQT